MAAADSTPWATASANACSSSSPGATNPAHALPSGKYDSYQPCDRSMHKSGAQYSANKQTQSKRASRTTMNVRFSPRTSIYHGNTMLMVPVFILDFADMIIDNDPPITRHISVPRDMSQLSCSALTAGIVEAVLDGLGFVSTPILLLVTSIEAPHGFASLSQHALRPTRYRQISIRNARPSSSSSTNPSWSAKKPSNNPNRYTVQHSV